MQSSDKKQIARWVETWQRAGSALEEVRRKELRKYDYTGNQAVVDEMLQWAVEHGRVRLTSGLVEQQRLFMKMVKLHRSKSSDRITPRSTGQA